LVYDSLANIVRFTNYRGKTTRYYYNPINNLMKVKDPDNISTLYQYDLNGNKNSLTDGKNHSQNFSIGKLNRLSVFTDGAGYQYSYNYDSFGNVRSFIKPYGSITYKYDKLNRVIKATMSSGDVYNYTYDANDNITSLNNNTGSSYFFYDSLNRIVRYVDPFSKQVLYGYNKVGSLLFIVYPGYDTVKYTYNAANRLLKVTDWKKNDFIYSYDSIGNVRKLLYPNGLHCDYTYDQTNRLLSKITYSKTNVIIYGQQFTYLYDTIKEIRYGSYPSGMSSSRHVFQYRSDDALVNDSSNIYLNDNNGNRIKEFHTTDTISYIYTTDQLLSSITENGITTTFGYDPLGHRIKRTRGSDQTRYVLDLSGALSLVLQTTTSSGVVRANYIYGLGLIERIDSLGTELFYHFDSRHNTIAISDKNDSIKATYTYTLFGIITSQTGYILQPFTFLGEFGIEKETESLYYIRLRYYDANTARFITKDFLFGDEFDPLTLNRYIYASNDPLLMYDITGLYGGKDNNGSVGQPEFLESFIPVWGSGRAAIDNFQNGEYGWGLFNTAMAITDLVLVKSLVTIGGKLLVKGATKSLAKEAVEESFGVATKGVSKQSTLEVASKTGLSTRFITTAEGVTTDLQPTLNRIASGEKFPHPNDGSIFNNFAPKGQSNPLLPVKPQGYYKEFVHPTPGESGPGAMRIITGQGGEMYFTPDHYNSFIQIR